MAQFVGFAFPFQRGTSSFPAPAEDDALIKQSLVQLVLTGTGERVMRPDYGGGAHSYIFEPNDELLQQRAETELFFLIGRYEPRISVTSITAVKGEDLPEAKYSENAAASIVITIEYIILSSRTPSDVSITISSGA